MDAEAGNPAFIAVAISIGIGCILVWLVLSLRLAWIARRTRMAPEIAMGAYFFLLAVAFIIGIPAAVLEEHGDAEKARFVASFSFACFWFGATALALGTWRTFRSGSAWAGWLCGVLFVAMGAAFGLTLASGARATITDGSLPNLVFGLIRCSVYAWAAAESFASYQRLRRQAALGLADPAVARRILFWGLGSLAIGGSALVVIVRAQMGIAEIREFTIGAFSPTFLSLAGTASVWLAFFPPAFLRSREGSLPESA